MGVCMKFKKKSNTNTKQDSVGLKGSEQHSAVVGAAPRTVRGKVFLLTTVIIVTVCLVGVAMVLFTDTKKENSASVQAAARVTYSDVQLFTKEQAQQFLTESGKIADPSGDTRMARATAYMILEDKSGVSKELALIHPSGPGSAVLLGQKASLAARAEVYTVALEAYTKLRDDYAREQASEIAAQQDDALSALRQYDQVIASLRKVQDAQ